MGTLNVQASSDASGSVFGLAVNPANHQILSRGNVVGAIQSFSPNESRTATKVMGIGIEGVISTALGNYSGGTFTTPLIWLYDVTPLESFGVIDQGGGVGGLRPLSRIKSLVQQRDPLDIRSIVYTPGVGDEILETYRNCYITAYSKSVSVTSATIATNVTWSYEKIV